MSPSPDRRGDRRPDRRPDRRSPSGPDRTPRRFGSGAGGRSAGRGAAPTRSRRPGEGYGPEKPGYDRGRAGEGPTPAERQGEGAYGRRPYAGRSGADGPPERGGSASRPPRERRPGDRFPPARPAFGRPAPGRSGSGRPSGGRVLPVRGAAVRRGPALFREADRPARPFQGRREAEAASSDGSDVDFRGEAAAFAASAPSDLIWGRHSTQATLESGRPIHRVWCTPEMRFNPRFLQLLREAKASGVLVEEVTWARLGQLTGGAVHQGIVLQPAAAETLDLASLIDGCRGIGEAPLLIAVDGLTDPQNLGAIVRSAEALGAHGMVLPQRRNAGLTGSVAKVAAGALEHLPVARVVNLNRSLDTLKQEGYRVVGLAEEGTVSLEEVELDGPLVVVTGSEGDGLSLLTRRSCDQLVRIPLRGATPSLNASVATALLLYEVARRGWMRGLRGSAPAPRIVRPSMPAPPDPEPAGEPTEAPEAFSADAEPAADPSGAAGTVEAEAVSEPTVDGSPETLSEPTVETHTEPTADLAAERGVDPDPEPLAVPSQDPPGGRAENARTEDSPTKPQPLPQLVPLGWPGAPEQPFDDDIRL